ncbi:hypothetical protein V8C42DRAFT_337954 [Trichoderma barbatum]
MAGRKNAFGLCVSATQRSKRCKLCYDGGHGCHPCPPQIVVFVRRLSRAVDEADRKNINRCRGAIKLLLEMIEEEDPALDAVVPQADPKEEAKKGWKAVADYIFRD